MFLKVIACEIAFREICHLAAGSPSLLDLEFLTQGLHDTPLTGALQVQQRIDAVPAGKYDALLLGYGLCGNIIKGLQARHTPLVIPRAHDCITFFVGSKERYARLADERPGTYYYSAGWLECLPRRGAQGAPGSLQFLPTRAGVGGHATRTYEQWVAKYGEEQARYLLEVMDQWTAHYTHGVLIDFDFTQGLKLREQVQRICTDRGWQFEVLPGDTSLLHRWLAGQWDPKDFLVVQPGQKVMPSYKDDVVEVEPGADAVSVSAPPADAARTP